jgi:preprotein translocase SecF subunit
MRRLRLVPDATNVDFFRWMRFWLVVSCLGVFGTLAILPLRGLNFGVDFRGGTLILAEVPEAQDIGEVRALLNGLGVGEVNVTEASGEGSGQVLLMRIGAADAGDDADASQEAVVTEVRGALDAAYPGIGYLQVDSVGGKVSGELVQAGALAVLLSLLAIMVYVWLRFEWQFGVGAVVSLLHDVIVTVGAYAVLQLEFNLTSIAAILTIIGYSINDTVVVFDRVRENLRKYKTTPLREVMNLALNETLSRTLMTSGTTLVALLALLLLGGPVTFGFAFAVMFGVLIGTYSSIWVASAIVLYLGVKRDWSKPDASAAGTQFGNAEG